MKFLSFAVAAILVLISGVVIAAEPKCPPTIQNSYECSKHLEAQLAREHPKLFVRSGTQLVISLANGQKKIYDDVQDEKNHGVSGHWYNFVQYYPEIGYGLIAVQLYEGLTHLLINMTTGKHQDIVSFPEISPDRKRIAVANIDLESGYTPNYLAVFELRPDGLVREFLAKPDGWGPGSLRWVSNSEISFVELRFNPDFPKYSDRMHVERPRKLKYQEPENTKVIKWAIE